MKPLPEQSGVDHSRRNFWQSQQRVLYGAFLGHYYCWFYEVFQVVHCIFYGQMHRSIREKAVVKVSWRDFSRK